MLMVWMRELAGWVLLGTGVAAFAVCYQVFLLQGQTIQAVLMAFVAFTVFRGGMHLLKVAMAAKAAREAPKPAPRAPRPATPFPGGR